MKNNFAGIVNLSRLFPKKFCVERTISLWIHLQFVGAMDVQLKNMTMTNAMEKII